MPRPISARICVAAMRHNLAVARAHAADGRNGGRAPAAVWAVVKANAYGHGLAPAVRAFEAADGLALVEFDAAVRLRESGWRGGLLMLEGAFEPSDVALARRHGLALVVHEASQLAWLDANPQAGGLDVVLKFNSGMNRLGFDEPGLRAAHARVASTPGVGRVTLMTHFANADVPGGWQAPLARFERACAGLAGARSTANSAALIDAPAARADAVRPGVMLYGGTPFAGRSASSLGLRAAMTLESALIAVRELAPGEEVGYGATFRATAPTRVGIVACGYADGYPRHAPGGTPVLVDGARCATVGRVSMDMLAVDLGPAPGARVGSRVELWGDAIPIDEVATAAGTIGYELMCALARRVPVTVTD